MSNSRSDLLVSSEFTSDSGTIDEEVHSKKSSLIDSEEGQARKTRQKWDKQREFILTVAGSCVGLGNVWRFPYLCYKYGGGAFFIPYLTFLFFAGIPTMIMEVSMGQFMSLGGIEVWNMMPIAKGVGYACLILDLWMNVYYIVILSWALFYFVQALSGHSPWSSCDNDFNGPCCSADYGPNGTLVVPDGCTGEPQLPESEYWFQRTLNISSGVDDTGDLRMELVGALIFLWIVVFFCVFKGIKSTGKAAYVTSSMPIIMLLFLVVRGISLPGASIGLKYFLTPNLEKAMNADVWVMAGSQVMFSYVCGQGVLSSLGSFNKYDFNVFKWTSRLCLLNCSASILAGVAIFSVLGNMSLESGVAMESVGRSGPGLAFIVYPRALSGLPFPQLWYCLFFGMLLMLGIASQCAEVEAVCTMIVDLKQHWFDKKSIRRPLFVALSCIVCFVMALPMVTQGGIFLFNLCDSYAASGIALLVIVFFECVAIGWCYGADRFYDDLHHMFGHKMNPREKPWTIFGVCWRWITPILCAVTCGAKVAAWQSPSYKLATETYTYPSVGNGIAICMLLSSIIAIPIFAIKELFFSSLRYGSISLAWKNLTTPVYPHDHPYSHNLKNSQN